MVKILHKYFTSVFSTFKHVCFYFPFLRLCRRRRPPPLPLPVRKDRRSVAHVTLFVWSRSPSRLFKSAYPVLSVWTVPALTAPPSPSNNVEEMGAPADRQKSSSSMKGHKGESVKGGWNKASKVYPAVPSTPPPPKKKPDSPGRLRIAALEAVFSSLKQK